MAQSSAKFTILDNVISGRTDSGSAKEISSTQEGHLEVALKEPVGAFGEFVGVNNIPVIQATAVYGLIPSNFREYTATGGSTGISNRMFTVGNGTSVGGYGAIQSFRALTYKAGQGAMARFTAVFTNNVASHWSGVGLVNLSDELSFGYNGTTFGIWYRTGGAAEVRTITVTGASGGSTNLTLTLNTVGYTIPLTAGTTAHNAYEIATWLNANQSVWVADQIGSTVIISAQSDGAKSGTYSYSHATSTGTIVQNTAGVTKTNNHISQASWNVNTYAALDPSKGNVYQIQYQYLGFGDIYFFVENESTGHLDLVHIIEYANNYTSPSLTQPALRFGMYSASTGTTTNVNVQCASVGCFTQSGIQNRTRNPRSVKNTQSVTTSFINILTLRNRRTYNYLLNQVEVNLINLSLSSESTKNVEVEIRVNPTFSGETNFSNAGTQLVTDIDTTANTVSGGTLIAAFTIGSSGSLDIDLSSFDIIIPPSLILTISARVTSGAASNVTSTLTYYEDL